MDLTKISPYYEQQKNEKCHHVERYGSRMGTKCDNKCSSLFCETHQEYNIDENTALNFLQTLSSNPALLHELLDKVVFLSTHHLFEDCEDDGCENCYSDDMDDGCKEELLDTLFEIQKASQKLTSTTSTYTEIPAIKVVPYGDNFREIKYGFIIKQSEESLHLLVSETEELLGRKLTDAERKTATSMGIVIN